MIEISHWLAIYLLIALVVAVWTIGAVFASSQGEFPSLAEEDWRGDLAFAALAGIWAGSIWPLGWLITLAFTDYPRYGWSVWPKHLDRTE